jgi:hypothetical protein
MQTADWVALAGAVVLLGAYAANQQGWLSPRRVAYSAWNLVGAALLAWAAILMPNVGFIVVETAWGLISLAGLVRALRGA